MRRQDNFFTYQFDEVFVQTTEGYASGIVGYQCGAGGHCRCDIWRQEGDQKKKTVRHYSIKLQGRYGWKGWQALVGNRV